MYYKYGVSYYKIINSTTFIEVTNSLMEHTVARGIDEKMVRLITNDGRHASQRIFMQQYQIALKDVNRYISPNEGCKYYQKGDCYYKVIDDECMEELFYSNEVKAKIRHTSVPKQIRDLHKSGEVLARSRYNHYLKRLIGIDWKIL